jgi:integrase
VHVHCMGKGRKERATPLTALTVAAHQGGPRDPLFATRTGTRLSRDALEHRLTGYLAAAAATAHHLRGKHVSIHTLRHTCAEGTSQRTVSEPASRSAVAIVQLSVASTPRVRTR